MASYKCLLIRSRLDFLKKQHIDLSITYVANARAGDYFYDSSPTKNSAGSVY